MSSMREFAWLLVVGLCCASGCTNVCVDDGAVFNQSLEACMTAAATAGNTEGSTTEGTATAGSATMDPTEDGNTAGSVTQGSMSATQGSMSATDSATDTTTDSATDSMTDSATGTTTSSSDTDSTGNTMTDGTTTGGGPVWCEDKDMDGFGDPMACVPARPGEDPPAGFVPNDDDCDDGDGFTFPGAAPNDSDTACMTDVDGDDWGDDTPSDPDAEPGTDCDDEDAATFPGSAEVESPDQCMKDEDGDGWGDTSVPPGVDVGSDCYDSNPEINPGDRVLYTAFDNGEFASVDVATGDVTVFASVDIAPLDGPYAVITCAISPTDGMIYCSQSAKQILIVVDYCSGDTPIELADHGRSICGLGFLDDGTLYGVDSAADELVVFDPMTGDVTDSMPLTEDGMDIDIQSCGMAVDCVGERMLVTDGERSRVLSIDPMTGEAAVVADIDEGDWNSVGLEFDAISKQVYTTDATTLYQIQIDGSDRYMTLPTLSTSINDLSYGPTCN